MALTFLGSTSSVVRIPTNGTTTTKSEEDNELLAFSATTGQVKVGAEIPDTPYSYTSISEIVETRVKEYITEQVLNDISLVDDDDDNPVTE